MSLTVKNRYKLPSQSRRSHLLPQRTMKREQRKKSIHRTSTIMLAMAVLLTGAGIAYTWYNGQHADAKATPAAPVYTPHAVFRPSKVASDAPLGVAMQMATTDVKPGENASVSIRTNPEADCTISVKYNNVAAADSGLVPKKADEFGVASWAWTIAPSAPKGTWPIEVDCKNKKHAAVVKSDVLIR